MVVEESDDRWTVTGRWWEGEPEPDWSRIRSSTGGIYKLNRERTSERRWVLYMTYD